MTNRVYLIGDEKAPKTNSWEAMTNSIEEANRLVAEMGPKGVVKEITSPPSRKRRKK